MKKDSGFQIEYSVETVSHMKNTWVQINNGKRRRQFDSETFADIRFSTT
jgi:hypothetical protein